VRKLRYRTANFEFCTREMALITARVLAAAMVLSALQLPRAAAQVREDALALPRFAACRARPHPLLPGRWRATYLMAPFTSGQLVLGVFNVDTPRQAMRVRLYGLRRGALDILVKGTKTFVVSAGGQPENCTALGDTGLRPLPQDWLAEGAVCEGNAPVAGLALDWWKTRSNESHSADWIWYGAQNHAPFRVMMTQPSARLAVLGSYALSYRVGFEPSGAAEDVAAPCEPAAEPAGSTGPGVWEQKLAAMPDSSYRADAEIADLMPGLEACGDAPLDRWEEKAAMSVIMTPPDFQDSPRPTEVLYDGAALSMRTRNFWPVRSELHTDDALLLNGRGYSIARTRKGELICNAGLPGALRPNWPETGGCRCEASLKGGTPLTPSGPLRILLCPMTAPRIVWSWFAKSGQPVVFMETSAPGDDPAGSLTLVDYHDWRPGYITQPSAFEIPNQCWRGKPGKSSVKPVHAREMAGDRCPACHTAK
jgi:hypothetical protein